MCQSGRAGFSLSCPTLKDGRITHNTLFSSATMLASVVVLCCKLHITTCPLLCPWGWCWTGAVKRCVEAPSLARVTNRSRSEYASEYCPRMGCRGHASTT